MRPIPAYARERDRALHVALIGGGIGGLSAALALRRAGLDVTIFERQPQLRAIGSGLTLWTNAVKILRRLDLFDALAAVSTPLERLEFWSWRGEPLGTLALQPLARKLGAPSVGVHRAELLALLADALGDECPVEVNARCVGFAQDDAGATATFADGRTATYDALVGADGLYSTVRACLWGPHPPRYAGYTCWRGVATFEHAAITPGISSETIGYGMHFGMLPIGQGRVYWYATMNAREGGEGAGAGEGDDDIGQSPADNPASRKQTVLRLFHRYRPPIAALIEATAAADILRHDIYDRPPARRWGVGRVTLLGDAAHPPTPNQGQGACQAIEDALALARCLQGLGTARAGTKGTDPVATALRSYEARRRARTAGIIRQSRLIGWVLQWHNPMAYVLREAGLRVTTSALITPQFQAVLGYEV